MFKLKVGQGLVGTAVAEGQPILVNDVRANPRYVEAVPGMARSWSCGCVRKGRVIGALDLLSETKGQFTEIDELLLRQFGAHVAVAMRDTAAVRARARVHPAPLESALGYRPRVRRHTCDELSSRGSPT